YRDAWKVQAGREAGLTGRRGVGGQAVQTSRQRAGDRVRPYLRVVHRVTAANRGARIAERMPAEAEPRREVLGRIGQGLTVVAKAGIDGQVVGDAETVLHEGNRHPLLQLVAGNAVADRLRVLLHVGQRQLLERSRRRAEEREGAQDCRAWLAACAPGRVVNE